MKSNTFKTRNILNKNLKHNDINEESEIAYVSRFLNSLLKEQDELPKSEEPTSTEAEPIDNSQKDPSEFTPEVNQQDFKNSLEKGTNPKDFEIEGTSPHATAETIASIREWSSKLDDFAEFLNNPAETTSEGKPSLHKILSDGDRSGSLLRGITRKASDSITRIAGEVEKLKEILNTYIITAPKKMRDTEGQAGWTQF